ncbi:MAG TPA: thioredoxin domain-containing protein, partial [Burkholderiaceae bacterium]|nr:thioredoxin domain-containing protein [Burkholderiaceae bacterium]
MDAAAVRPANRLARETSPYLLQHAHNPVDWFPWSEEAFAKARAEDKPILLSVGYATCHWCHVMERESFEDEALARQLNAGFVAIKVDREELPDVDHVYMSALQALTGRGGWPMNMFLTPQLKPFFGGSYFPPDRRHGLPGFPEVLAAVREAWTARRADVE